MHALLQLCDSFARIQSLDTTSAFQLIPVSLQLAASNARWTTVLFKRQMWNNINTLLIRNGVQGLQSHLGADRCTVHDSLASVKLVWVIKLLQPLWSELVAAVNDPPNKKLKRWIHKPCFSNAAQVPCLLGSITTCKPASGLLGPNICLDSTNSLDKT